MGVRTSKLSKIVGGPRVIRSLRGSLLTPRGYIPVSVGVNYETKRFMVHMTALGDQDFMEFLRKSAEEYGFCNDGILRIPFEAKAFEEWMIKGGRRKMLRVRPT